jgi:hypothetical protein
MTRDEFLEDVHEALRLLARLGALTEHEAADLIASMRAGRPSLSPSDLRRYADTIDWNRQSDVQTLGALARVLLRLLAGLGEELESFRMARGRD